MLTLNFLIFLNNYSIMVYGIQQYCQGLNILTGEYYETQS